jgi:RNA polymerase sigma factor (sigma-70 family)
MVIADQELVRRCRRRDEEAFRLLVQRHQRSIYSLIWRMVGNSEDARDLTQETFVRTFRALDQFDLTRPFGNWISRIATNVTIDFLRKKKLRTVSLSPDPEDDDQRPMEIVDARPRPDEHLESGREREELDRLIARLAPHYRIVVHLRHVQQKSYEEIAEILDLPLGTVKARLHRAHNQLRAWLLGETGPVKADWEDA